VDITQVDNLGISQTEFQRTDEIDCLFGKWSQVFGFSFSELCASSQNNEEIDDKEKKDDFNCTAVFHLISETDY